LKTEIVINVASNETRIAILEDGKLVEILVERPEKERMVGDIYKGTVSAVLPGMQAAFVDIGQEKSAFLHVSDMVDSPEFLSMFDDADDEPEPSGRGRNGRHQIPIQDMLQKGQEILVQVTKEPISTKGPRVTSEISLAGRFIVLVPNGEQIGVSRKIANWEEKRRLKDLVRAVKPGSYGTIIRTVAEGRGEKELQKDLKGLVRLWERIQKAAQKASAPALVHKEMGMTSSLIRDLFNDDVTRVVVDSKHEYRQILSYLKSVSPHLKDRVSLSREKIPIFDAFGVESEIEKCYDRRVWLKGGGNIVIDHTEAMVVIDVNSAKNVGRDNEEDKALRVNMEAAREVARQIRLRDLGGIIVVDFIDMAHARNRRRVEEEFQQALRRDRSKTHVSQLSEFGLIQMTRQRVRPSLFYTFSDPCAHCGGLGRVQGRDTTVARIERWLRRSRAASLERRLTVRVHPTVYEYLTENKGERFKLMRKATRVWLAVESDPALAIDDYRIYSRSRKVDVTEEFKT
jgi:ribonuclease G